MKKFILLILIILIPKITFCQEISFEFDRFGSFQAGAKDTRSLYTLLNSLENGFYDDSSKILSTIPLSYICLGLGHEYFGHGSITRKLGIEASYCMSPLSFSTSYWSTPKEDALICYGGQNFNNELKKQELEYQIMNDFDYRSSSFLIMSKTVSLGTLFINNSGSDFAGYTKSWKKVYPDTNLDLDYIKRLSVLSMLDPVYLMNLVWFSKDSYQGEVPKRNLNMLVPSIDMNIWPCAVTTELSISKRLNLMNNNYFIRLSGDYGKDVNNNYVSGCGLEIGDIPIIKNWVSLDLIGKYVDNCISETQSTLRVKNLYMRYSYKHVLFSELDSKTSSSFGLTFNL